MITNIFNQEGDVECKAAITADRRAYKGLNLEALQLLNRAVLDNLKKSVFARNGAVLAT